MDSVARMLVNTVKHYSFPAYINIIAYAYREREEHSRLRLSSASVCRSEACRPHVVRVVFGTFMVHPRNHQRIFVEAVVSTDEREEVLPIHDHSQHTCRWNRGNMPNNPTLPLAKIM